VRAFVLFSLVVATTQQMQTWPSFFIMMFENHGYNQVTANSYWASIMSKAFSLTNYHGVTHPSQPNYIAQLAGNYFNCTTDGICNLKYPNLVDLCAPANVTWRAYMEDYVPLASGACNGAEQIGLYYRKHDPFMSFIDITTNLTRCQQVVSAPTQFQKDLANNVLPMFGYYTPNINDDSHDRDLNYSGQYLQNWLNQYYYPNTGVGKPFHNTLFMVTFDEDSGTENNHVVAFFFGPNCTAGASNNGTFNHYSVTAFVEQNWNLGNLGQNDVTANNFANVIY